MRNLLSYHWAPAPEPAPFVPWANTILYFPFENDADDHSWNWYSLDVSGTQETIGRTFNTYVYLNKSSEWTKFISCWIKILNRGSWYSSSADWALFAISWPDWYMCYRIYDYYWSTDAITYTYRVSSSTQDAAKVTVNSTIWEWVYLCWYYDSNVWSVGFINWQKYIISTQTPRTWWEPTRDGFFLNKWTTKASITLSDVIAESVIWTDQQITDYFNATKSKYWVS